MLEAMIEDIKRRFTLSSTEAYDLSFFTPKHFLYQNMLQITKIE